MNKKLSLIVALQAFIIIVLFWVLIFYGRDEYEAYQSSQEEEIESPSRITEKAGVSVVHLPLPTQQNSGIKTIKVISTDFRGEIKSFGNVVNIVSLIDAKSNYLNLKTNANLAQANNQQNIQQYQRLKTLNDDDKNVSDRAVQEALAAVNAENANVKSYELQLQNLKNSTRLRWGEALSALIFNEKSGAHLSNLIDRKNVLIQVSLPLATNTPASGSTIKISPLNDAGIPIQAIYVSPAATADTNGFGKTFYYSAPADQLRIGMRVNVELGDTKSNAVKGVIIPNNAVVWYAGTPWAYFKQGQDHFVRKPISADNEVDTGWFNKNLSADSEVVVNGAQLLLSEEFKYLIKNENDD
jgi:hypothetical protein